MLTIKYALFKFIYKEMKRKLNSAKFYQTKLQLYFQLTSILPNETIYFIYIYYIF